MSVRKLERDPDHSDGVDGTAAFFGGPEVDFCGSVHRILVESKAKAVYDAEYAEVSGSGEEHLQHDIAFEAFAAGFVRVGGPRLG
jgi:hypothetical protein